MSKIEIRNATIKDSVSLSQLNFEFNGVNIDPQQVSEKIETGNELVAIALIEKEAVAFATAQVYKSFCYTAHQGEITEMYVREKYRGKGISRMLLEFLEEELLKNGVSTVKILTGADNSSAITAYKKAGYTPDEEVFLYKKLKKKPS